MNSRRKPLNGEKKVSPPAYKITSPDIDYFSLKFGFLDDYIPAKVLRSIFVYMTAKTSISRRVGHKLYHKNLDLSLDDLFSILAFYQLYLYGSYRYLKDSLIRKIDDHLMESDPIKRNHPYISSKQIQLAEKEILEDAFATIHEVSTKTYSSVPEYATNSVNVYLRNPLKYIPARWRLYDRLKDRPVSNIPTTIVVWVVRKELMKHLYPSIAIEYDISLLDSDFRLLDRAIEEFFIKNFTAQIGDIVPLCLLFVGIYKGVIIELPENQPKRYIQRTNMYLDRFGKGIHTILSNLKKFN